MLWLTYDRLQDVDKYYVLEAAKRLESHNCRKYRDSNAKQARGKMRIDCAERT